MKIKFHCKSQDRNLDLDNANKSYPDCNYSQYF